MLLQQPLNELEYEELDQFLLSDAVGEEAMDVSMLDGFLTAIVIGPRVQPPSRWLPLVWGQKEMVWDSEAQATRMISLVMRHMNAIASLFAEGPEEFEPLLPYRKVGEDEIPVLEDWCVGFVAGIELDAEGWQPLLDDDENGRLLHPVILYGTPGGWQQLEKYPDLAARHAETVEELPATILGIHDFWLSYRRALAATRTLRHEQPLPGRNDPCTCGSGKKFKKCCGV